MPLVNIQLGEVIFGGVGAGLYGMLIFVLLAVFIAGLMVGRTPEYLGKKIEAREVQLAPLYVLIFPFIDFSPPAAWHPDCPFLFCPCYQSLQALVLPRSERKEPPWSRPTQGRQLI